MAEAALNDFEHITFFDHRDDNITFANTLPDVHKKFPKSEVCLILGSDILEHLSDWPEASEYLPTLELCVVLRDNKQKDSAKKLLEKLNPKSYRILPAVWSPVSSSKVRQEILETKYSDVVHKNVLAYIKKHRLYIS